VIIQAVKDAKQGNTQAIYWLYSTDAAFYVQLAGHETTVPLAKIADTCRPKIAGEPWQPREARR
jgi:hypothetical protein